MSIFENPFYREDVAYIASLDLPWDKIQGKSMLLSGASGLIGSFLIDVIMKKMKLVWGAKFMRLAAMQKRRKFVL